MNQSDINETLMDYNNFYVYVDYHKIEEVSTWLTVIIGLILMLVAIVAVSYLVKKDNVAPIFVINLLVSDVFQLCTMIIMERRGGDFYYSGRFMYSFSLMASVGFMLCIALERYLAIVWPLWYQTRRTVKMSLLLCAVVWTLPLVYIILEYSWDQFSFVHDTVFSVLLLLLFALLVFFLVGTLRALSASISVRAEEKRRIVGLLVLVLLIYTLLFLPYILSYLVLPHDFDVYFAARIVLRLNPVADLFLYIFLKKGAVNQVWFCLCCCRKKRTSRQSSSGLNDGDKVTSL